MPPSPKKTTTDSLGESIEPSAILISFLLFTLHFLEDSFVDLASNLSTNSSLKFEIMAKQLYVASQRVL